MMFYRDYEQITEPLRPPHFTGGHFMSLRNTTQYSPPILTKGANGCCSRGSNPLLQDAFTCQYD